jgi:anti-sigma factor RsiW
VQENESKNPELSCVDPGAIQEWEMDAYAEGEALPHVVEHLNRCPACRAKLEANLGFERRLRQALHRFDCPSPDLLRDYYWGYLPAGQQREVRDHLAWCPHCADELSELGESMAVEKAELADSLLARAQQAAARVGLIVAQLVSPDPRLASALRGEAREVLLFEAGDLALSIHSEQAESGAYTLWGQALSLPVESSAEDYVRLTGYEEGEEAMEAIHAVQAAIDANGVFTLADLRPGTYQLVVSLADQRMVVPNLMLKAEP